jgi:hypothetical protein
MFFRWGVGLIFDRVPYRTKVRWRLFQSPLIFSPRGFHFSFSLSLENGAVSISNLRKINCAIDEKGRIRRERVILPHASSAESRDPAGCTIDEHRSSLMNLECAVSRVSPLGTKTMLRMKDAIQPFPVYSGKRLLKNQA